MIKDSSDLVAEIWELLVDYIPRRDQETAAEQLVGYLKPFMDEQELENLVDLNSDLSSAYYTLSKEDEELKNFDEDEE